MVQIQKKIQKRFLGGIYIVRNILLMKKKELIIKQDNKVVKLFSLKLQHKYRAIIFIFFLFHVRGKNEVNKMLHAI